MLCKACRSIKLIGNPGSHELHDNIYALKEAAEKGCELCQEVYDQAMFVVSDNDNAIDMDYLGIIFYSSHNEILSFFAIDKMVEENSAKLLTSFELYVDNQSTPKVQSMINGRPRFFKPDEEGCFDLIRGWMSDCLATHEEYCPPQTSVMLPTRVLNVGKEQESDVFLETVTPGEMGSYVALSHCWGQGPHFSTTTSNILCFEHSIALEDLPATFRDAILVTRTLGFQFLWIDSLCIIQDSHEDWLREAASMHSYYKRAALTIAAASANGDQVGFLGVERECGPPLAGLSLDNSDPNEHPSNAAENTGATGTVLLRHKIHNPREELSKRAWTLQENLLSPRTVHYTSTELRWECQSKICSETKRVWFGQEQNPHPKFHFLAPSDKPLPHTGDSQKQFARWYQISSEYAERSLTIPSDKLYALSGLAREFQRQTQATYLAGMWREDIVCGMAWSYFSRGRKTEEYRAPSWSWAAMDVADDAKVKSAMLRASTSIYPANLYWEGMERNRDIEKAELLDCKMTLKDDDPFGAITRGDLTLQAFCREWPQNPQSLAESMFNPPFFVNDGSWHLLNRYAYPIEPATQTETARMRILCNFDEVPDTDNKYLQKEFYLDITLAVLFSQGVDWHYALLLKPAVGEEGKFVKVGLAQFPETFGDDAYEEFGWEKRRIVII